MPERSHCFSQEEAVGQTPWCPVRSFEWSQSTTNNKWSKTSYDGFGRPFRVETGYTNSGASTTVSRSDYEYESCGCTPMGKLRRSTRPYNPNGGAQIWTTMTYDGLGRTLRVDHAGCDGSTNYL